MKTTLASVISLIGEYVTVYVESDKLSGKVHGRLSQPTKGEDLFRLTNTDGRLTFDSSLVTRIDGTVIELTIH